MLTLLLFNRAPKRRVVGLLALGEWGPATGAISGSISTEQPRQETIASGAVVEPVIQVVSGGGGGGGGVVPLGPYPRKIPAITGVIKTCQKRQQTSAVGEVIDTELEMMTDFDANCLRESGIWGAGACRPATERETIFRSECVAGPTRLSAEP